MRTPFVWVFGFVGLLAAQIAPGAEIGVTPVAVQLDANNDRATVNVVNSGQDTVIMQVEAIAWNRVDGRDEHSATSDIIINPPVFTMKPGQAQVVRVGLRRSAQAAREQTYRIVLREVPSPLNSNVRMSGQVQVLMALRVPVYVAPRDVVREVRWQARREPDGNVVASVRNEGNVHVKVAGLRLRAVDTSPLPESVMRQAANDAGMAAVVFAGEDRKFQLRDRDVATASSEGPWMLDITTDHGLQSVPVELALR